MSRGDKMTRHISFSCHSCVHVGRGVSYEAKLWLCKL